LASRLSVFDIEKGAAEAVLVTDRLIEAPNWTNDGSSLIVNGSGRLYRVPLNTPELQEIETGFALDINNDHGISPDGKSLVISDSTEFGTSCIYTLSIKGGAPTRVTENVPSYWHGWSPDGGALAYVGKRHETFQVYTCAREGGSETQLTDGFEHCDGPDYTPDGRWIWFNGERAGEVQLWRMRADGSNLQRMTNDSLVNWFPHPSPNGRHVLYLAYEAGTRGHPAMQSVELRLMPSEGGEPTTLLRLTGGQGTINVPCWAPDSGRFAFMSYGD
jgi:Tol biopolymer transport system component